MTYWQKLKSLFSWKDLFFTVLLFGIMLMLAFCNAESQVQVKFQEESVDIVSAKFTMNIPYDMVEEINLVEYPEDAELLNGNGDISLHAGLFSNSAWGEYNACVDLGAKQCITVLLDDGRLFVFSRKNDEETAAIFDTFQTYLNP